MSAKENWLSLSRVTCSAHVPTVRCPSYNVDLIMSEHVVSVTKITGPSEALNYSPFSLEEDAKTSWRSTPLWIDRDVWSSAQEQISLAPTGWLVDLRSAHEKRCGFDRGLEVARLQNLKIYSKKSEGPCVLEDFLAPFLSWIELLSWPLDRRFTRARRENSQAHDTGNGCTEPEKCCCHRIKPFL